MNFLSEIISRKYQQLDAAKRAVALDELRPIAQRMRNSARAHAFRRALSNTDQLNVIAEFKRRSPSKGLIRAGANPVEIANEYVAGGAKAISVLTEENYFDGSLDDLKAIRDAVTVPLLRKDFMWEKYQVYEAAAAGADAVLLIVAALDDGGLISLREIIEEELGMDALVEVHDKLELKRAVATGATLIGVNNRDLRTFEVSIETSSVLIKQAPADAVMISESGLKTTGDLQRLRQAGYHGFLIGESLMRAPSPKEALLQLLGTRS